MKRYLFGRIFGILLAGILTIESSIPVFATEIATETPQIETVQEEESEEVAEVEVVEEEEAVEPPKEEHAEPQSSEAKPSESVSSENKEVQESKSEELSKEESSSVIEASTVEESTEKVESSTEESSTEGNAVDESSVQEEIKSTDESASEKETEEIEEITEEETEEETETTTEEMTEELSKVSLFNLTSTLPTPTTAPSNVSVAGRTATTATILWETIDGYTEYEIHRSTNADTGFSLLDGGTIETSSNLGAFLDTSCESGKIYYYKVCAIVTSDDGEVKRGPFSAIVNNSVALQQVTLSETALEMNKGVESVLSITYAPSYAAGMYSVSWSSDNTSVATVTDGKITAVGAGTAMITATAGDKTATCEVTVKVPLEQISLNKTEVEIAKDKKTQLTESFKPQNTTDEVTLSWSSSDKNVVTVVPNELDGKLAELTAVGAGTAVITVTAGDVTAECLVKVVIPATDVALSSNTIQLLEKDDSINVTINVEPANATDEVSYVVDDPDLITCELGDRVLTVSSLGTLGTTQVHISVGEQTLILNVQVVEEKQSGEIVSSIIPVDSIAITATWTKKAEDDNANDTETNAVPINLRLGEDTYSKATVSAKVSPANATNQEIAWSSSDEAVAIVDENGVVSAVGIGRASIIATADNDITEKVTVVVVPEEGSFVINGNQKITLYCNETLPELAVQNGVKGTQQISVSPEMECQYRSSNEAVASVDATGLITAHKPGTALISVIGKQNGDVQTVQVTVRRIVESIELPLDEITVIKGTQPQLTFKAFPTDASVESLNTIKVVSSNTEYIKIDSNWTKGKTSGTFKFSAKKETENNETPITITITAGDTYYDEALKKTVTVTSVKKTIQVYVDSETSVASSIKVSGKNKMQSGTEQQLGVIVKDKSGNELNTTLIPIGYTSSNTEIATVDKNGSVTALKGGKVTITAFVMNGSNVKVDYAITVEQRPEDIVFDRTVYGVSKAANKSATVTVQPRFVPATTANKNVTWSVTEVTDSEGTPVEGTITDYFAVDAKGKVTVKAKATEGMQAVITCTSKAYAANEEPVTGTVIVEVQPKKVTAVKFTKATVEAVGLTEHELAFSTTFAKGYDEAKYEAYTSDAEIATAKVENGQVILDAHKYGTVTVTLCADQAVTATCKVTIYPVARGAFAAKQATYLLQQAQYNGNDRVQLQFVDSKTKKIVVDPKLFTYQSSNPDVVYVDENGVAYANAVSNGKIMSKNNQVTITATLKDDPDKRKVTTKVMVCVDEQIERMDVTYYPTKSTTKGTDLTDNGTGMVFDKSGQQFKIRVTAYGADNERISNPQLTFTSSDSSLATVTSQSMKTFEDSDYQKYQAWEAVITVKQAGRFSINVAAQDQKKYARNIHFVAYSAKPILTSSDLGTVNRNSEIVKVTDQEGEKESIASDKTFKVLGSDETEITSVSVQTAKVKLKSSNKIETIAAKKFAVREVGTNEYRLYMLESEMDNVVDGTYSITLKVERTLLGNEDDDPGYVENPETTTTTLNANFKIASTLPKLSTAKITLNTFIKGDMVKIPINTTEMIENISIDSTMVLANELEIVKQGKDWYAKIKDSAFENWKKTTTSGKLYVKFSGYETPVAMNLNVTCKSTKPVVKQEAVPSIRVDEQGKAETYITLIDAQKKVWEDYAVELKSSTPASKFQIDESDESKEKTKIVFENQAIKLNAQGVTLTEKVLVSKEEWRSPIEISISVKAYNDAKLPIVGFEKTTININKAADEEYAETKIKLSHSNIELNEGEWTISDTCKYKTVENKQTVWHQSSDAFNVEYKEGVVKVSLRENVEVPNGTYKLTMTNLWDGDKAGAKPLTTGTLTVVVKNVEPKVTVKMSGQLDLVKRSQSTLKGTITVSNVNGTVKRVRLLNSKNDGFADKFYCTRKDNTFTIYARSSAVLTTSKITGNVEITLSNGKVLNTKISFTPKQSVPSVITPANETIYKSTAVKTVDYNFNEKLTDGVKIADIKATSVPTGLKVQDSNGHLYVTLGNKSLKQGKYKIVVNVYFKGAQAISGDAQGKAVKKTIYVEVKE